MNSFIQNIHISSGGRIVADLSKELDQAGIKYERGPMCFSPGATEYLNALIPLATGSLPVLAGILIAYIKRGKKIQITYHDNGRLKSVDAANYSSEELAEVLNKVKDIDIHY